jgi:hypothetical protein
MSLVEAMENRSRPKHSLAVGWLRSAQKKVPVISRRPRLAGEVEDPGAPWAEKPCVFFPYGVAAARAASALQIIKPNDSVGGASSDNPKPGSRRTPLLRAMGWGAPMSRCTDWSLRSRLYREGKLYSIRPGPLV